MAWNLSLLGAIGATILGSGTLSAFITHFLNQQKSTQEKAMAVRFLATKICFCLERFAIMVASDHADIEDAIYSRGDIGRLHHRIRDFPALPESDDYNLFDNSLLNEILDFPDRVVLSNDEIERDAEVEPDPSSTCSRVSKKCRELGTDGLNLAERIRAQYKLPKRDLEYGDYNVRDWLKLQKNK